MKNSKIMNKKFLISRKDPKVNFGFSDFLNKAKTEKTCVSIKRKYIMEYSNRIWGRKNI